MGSDDPDPANVLRRPSATEAESNFTTTWDLSFAKPTAHPSSNTTATSSRSLAGITVEATEIDEIFRLYFTHYSQHLPVLDPNISPNGYYDQSPLLFWAIIGVGVRRYTANPTLLGSLAERIVHLASPLLHPTPAVIPAIQGLLLLSSFPFPTDSTSKDTSYTLSGMAINLALQIGLHVPTFSQDYSRSKMTLTQEDIQRRVQLWFHCIIVHQKAACGLGYPIMVSPDRLQKQMDLRGLLDSVPPFLLFEMRQGSLLSRINTLFSPSTFRVEDTQDKHSQFAREMMSDTFENQLDELESERKLTDLEQLYVNITRLQLRVHCLQDRENPATSVKVAQLGLAATSIIEGIEQLEVQMSLIQHCPHYIFRMTALAASVLLRLSKQQQPRPRARGSDADHHRQQNVAASKQYKPYFFQTISLLKRMSVESNDMPSRMAKIFSQLWSIDKIFEHTTSSPPTTSDGTGTSPSSAAAPPASSPLVVQSRLSMSVLHDCMWRWKDRFRWAATNGSQTRTAIDSSSADRNTSHSNGSLPNSHQHPPVSRPVSTMPPTPTGFSTSYNMPPDTANAAEMVTADTNFHSTMTMPFADSFSPLGTLPWDAAANQDFEMMIHRFPESWPV
ncbi:hypothetical protein, variant [Exophiala xenobiotica]|nr:hypothetical protein, variant [Exophiala xenobiotica]KIW57122.1 hypothetical protein, variant [Exophiala xenobiotica]